MNHFHDLFSFFFAPLLGLALDGGAGGGDGSGAAAPAGGAAAPAGGGTPAPAGGAPAQGAAAPGAAASVDLGFLDAPLPKGWAKAAGLPEAWEGKFTTLKPALGSYAAAEKLVGAKGIIPPGPDATPEQKAAFYKALGRPDKPEEYGIKMPEKVGDKPFPKELWNDEQAQGFAKWAHERGFNKEQVNALIEFDAMRGMRDYESVTTASQKAQADAITALKSEWGTNYDANLQLAQKAAKELGGDELLGHALANDPAFIKAMAKVGEMTKENATPGARTTSHAPSDPKSKIAAIKADLKHAWQPTYAQNGHSKAQHEAAVAEMKALFEQAFPG
jgi:hypothetical protein